MSLVLRHSPETIGIRLDAQGWVSVDELVSRSKGKLTWQIVRYVVETSEKKRFALSEDGSRIRASQGHSVDIDLGLVPSRPPAELYHGTASRFIDSIRKHGLLPGSRKHVHLSLDRETAINVGKRHGKPVILTVLAGQMNDCDFWLSDNGVWLTRTVAPDYLVFPEED